MPKSRFHKAKPTLRGRKNCPKDCEKVLYRFQGSQAEIRKEGSRDLNCILTTAQRMILNKGQLAEEEESLRPEEHGNMRYGIKPDETSENGVLGSGGNLRNHFNFDLVRIERIGAGNRLVSGSSDEKIKLQRAQGGCQGTIRRRRTW